MTSSRKKNFVVTVLLLTGLFQGWPLIVAAQCRMLAASSQACEMKSACCCDQGESTAARGFSKCTTGAKLAGVLSTDPSLLSLKEKIDKSVLFSLGGEAIFSNHSTDSFSSTHFISDLHTLSTPRILPSLFLFDCVLRI